MKKGLIKKIIIGSAVLGGLAGLAGCDSIINYNTKELKSLKQNITYKDYFSYKGIIAEYPSLHSQEPVALAVGDMDGDGDLDELIAKSSKTFYFENIGNGVYAKRGVIAEYPSLHSQEPVALAVGDMDGDGDLDISVAKSYKTFYFENNLPQKNKIKEDEK